MKFLVILICLTINYLWLKDFERFNDAWFFKFRCRMENLVADFATKYSSAWLLGMVLIYGIPLFVLGIILFFTADKAFGIPTMMVHILVLLVAFDRTQPGKLANAFLEKWNAGDLQACSIYLQQELTIPESELPEDEESLGVCFSKLLVLRCFEKMFVMFFWYMVAGPMGIVFCYVSYQLRDGGSETQVEVRESLVLIVIRFLEWIPMRLLAITFSLAGNFVQCFDSLKQSIWDFSMDADYAGLLYGYARCALSGSVEPVTQPTEADSPASKAAEIAALQALLERSQVIWLTVLALTFLFSGFL